MQQPLAYVPGDRPRVHFNAVGSAKFLTDPAQEHPIYVLVNPANEEAIAEIQRTDMEPVRLEVSEVRGVLPSPAIAALVRDEIEKECSAAALAVHDDLVARGGYQWTAGCIMYYFIDYRPGVPDFTLPPGPDGAHPMQHVPTACDRLGLDAGTIRRAIEELLAANLFDGNPGHGGFGPVSYRAWHLACEQQIEGHQPALGLMPGAWYWA